MALDAATIRILLETDSSGMVRGFATGSAAATGFGNTVQSSLDKAGRAFRSLTTTQKLLAGVTVGGFLLGKSIAAVVGPAIEFESAFAGVRKTVDGTPAQLEQIRVGLLDMSRVMPTSASELASIAENAGQLGVAAPDVLEFTRVIAQLGETTDLSFDGAAQSLARFLNITGNDASITAIADVIVDLGNNSATTESQIVDFSTRLASAFTVAGATEDQILGVAAAFSSMGLRAEAGGSALSRIITSVSDAAAVGGDELATYASVAGLIPDEFAEIAATNPVEAFILFSEGLGRMQAEGKAITPVLESLNLGGLRTSEVFRLAALNSDLVRDSLARAATQFEEGGATAEEYGKRIETTASRLEVFQNRMQALAITLGTPLLAGFAVGVDSAGDAIERLADLLTPLANEIGVTFTNLASAAVQFGAAAAPAVQLVAGVMLAAVDSATGLLEMFNQFGTTGLIFAALALDIALVGPASITAAKGLTAVAAAGGGATGALTATRAAAGGLLASINPLTAALVLLAGLYAVGQTQVAGFRREAEKTAAVVRNELNASLTEGDFDSFSSSLLSSNDRLKELRVELEAVTQQRFDELSFFGIARTDVDPFNISPTTKRMKELAAEIEALEGALDGLDVDKFNNRMTIASNALGLSREATFNLAQEMGFLETVVAGSSEEFLAATDRMIAHQDALATTSAATQDFISRIYEGNVGLEEYAAELDLTMVGLQLLAERVEGVDLSDLQAEDASDQIAAFTALAAALGLEFEDLAAALGISTDELLRQEAAVEGLAAAHNELRQAVENALSQQRILAQQQDATTASLAAFDGALTTIGENDGPRLAAEAMREYLTNFAASGVTIDEFKAKQDEAVLAILAAGESAGIAQEELILYIAQYGTVPEEVITRLILDGLKAKEDLTEFQALQLQTQLEQLVRLGVIDEATAEMIFAQQVGEDFRTNSGVGYEAQLTADNSLAMATSALTEEEFFRVINGVYIAQLEADNSNALEETDEAETVVRTFVDAQYTAKLEADNTDSIDKTRAAQEAANNFATTYTATLKANDEATNAIRSAQEAGNNFANTYTATFRTVYQTVGSPPSRPASANSTSSQTFFYADGAIALNNGSVLGPIREQSGYASIYRPTARYRLHSEPETGGEAYIPLASDKRLRSRAIWWETGRLLGMFNSGGLAGINQTRSMSATMATAGSIMSLSAPMSFDLSGRAGMMSDRQIIEAIDRRVAERMQELAFAVANGRS